MPTTYRRELLANLAARPWVPNRARTSLLRLSGVRFAGHAQIFSGLRVVGEGELRFGIGAFVNHDCLIDRAAAVTIGDGVALGNRVALITSGHDIGGPEGRAGQRVCLPIRVEDGAWIGANATVLGGVTVGAGSVIGAGAVVTRDVPAHTLWVGVPARLVRPLPG